MRGYRRRGGTGLAAAATASLLALAGCTPHYVPAAESGEFPRVRYALSGDALNDRCPVSRTRLNTRIDPVHLNGRAIGFC